MKNVLRTVMQRSVLDEKTGCIEMLVGLNKATGYSRITIGGKSSMAHRWVWETLFGPIETGLQLDHLCRNRKCVNPEHLEPVTPRENALRGTGPTAKNATKTECMNGHALVGRNLILRAKGWRGCRECHYAEQAKYRASNKELLRLKSKADRLKTRLTTKESK